MRKILGAFRRSLFAVAIALLFAGHAGMASSPAHADSTKKTFDSIGKMLKDAGYKAKPDGNSYVVLFNGKGIGEFPVIYTAVDDLVVIVSYIAPAAKITKSPDLAAGLLEANYTYSLLKIVFDPKGNLLFRYDIHDKLVDGDDIKELTKTMVDNTVNFYNAAPFIKK